MKEYFGCTDPYPLFCKVWNNNEKEVYFAIVIDKHHGRFIDHNVSFWDNAVRVNDLSNPIELLEGYSQYDSLTVPAQEQDFR